MVSVSEKVLLTVMAIVGLVGYLIGYVVAALQAIRWRRQKEGTKNV